MVAVNVSEVRCTSCLAPVDPSRGATQRCAYCGAVLAVSGPALAGRLRLDACGPNKIQVIKVVREYTNLGLKEAKDITESTPYVIEKDFEATRLRSFLSDLEANGARASLVSGVAPPAPEPPTGGVMLEDCGPNKIGVIKVIREHTGLGLREAKDLADAAPCVIAEGCDAARAKKLRDDLVAQGAHVR